MTGCPLDCSPGRCIPTNSIQQPYACLCNGTVQPDKCPRY